MQMNRGETTTCNDFMMHTRTRKETGTRIHQQCSQARANKEGNYNKGDVLYLNYTNEPHLNYLAKTKINYGNDGKGWA